METAAQERAMREKLLADIETYQLVCAEYLRGRGQTLAERIVLAVMKNLLDRRGAKWELQAIDWAVGWERLQSLRDDVDTELLKLTTPPPEEG